MIMTVIIITLAMCFAAEAEDLDPEVFFRRVKEVEVPDAMCHLVTQSPKHIGKYGIAPTEIESDLRFLKENK